MSRREFLTMSKAPIWMECSAAPVLPHVLTVPGLASTKGSAVHAFLEHANTKPVEEALRVVDEEHRDLCAAVNVDRLPLGLGGEAEAAYALDVRSGTARRLGASMGRDYSMVAEYEVAGTLDLAHLDGTRGRVDEYKTGFGVDAHVAPVARNHQVRLQALSLARAHGLQQVDASIHRISDSGYVDTESVRLDALDLAEIEHQARTALERIDAAHELVHRGRTPDARPGSWCTYCPAMEACPAHVALLREAVNASDGVETRFNTLLNDPATRARAYSLWSSLRALSGRMGEAVHALTSREPIVLDGGNVFGPQERKKLDIDAEAAFALLRERHGVEAAVEAVSMETSVAGLKRAAKKAGVPQDPTARALVEELRALGKVRESTSTSVREYRPK